MEDLVRVKTPQDARHKFRRGEFFSIPTSGLCKGYKQANLLVVHKDFADDLEKYSHMNYGPMPVIHRSKPGTFGIPEFSTDTDVRTDLPAYNVVVNGELKEVVADLTGYGDQLQDFCFFYIGCSFSFEDALLSGGIPLRNLEQDKTNCSMYTTKIQCHGCGVFSGRQVVSMRPIPKELVERAFQITHPLTDVHGAPMHIGDPAVIGLGDLTKVDFGNSVKFSKGDIPVFWPCGVTAFETVKSANLPLAFTHKPGSMLITDTPVVNGGGSTPPGDLPRVVWLSDAPPLASVLSQAAMDKIKRMEEVAVEDIGERQIGNLLVPDDLMKSALSLSHATSIAITTGFPVMMEGDNIFETDGPPGAVAMASTLQALGKEVVLVVDDVGGLYQHMEKLVGLLVKRGILSQPIPVECYPPTNHPATCENAMSFLTHGDGRTLRFDHLVAIERAGRGKDGRYMSFSGADRSSRVGTIDLLFEVAKEMPHVFTTGIGDGGNEVGMGKVWDRVVAGIPRGETIACATTTDYLVCVGVANWGGYALSAALTLLRQCPIHDRYRRYAIGLPPSEEERRTILAALPTVEKEEKFLRAMNDLGFKDPNGNVAMIIDWLPFHDIHADKISEILAVLE